MSEKNNVINYLTWRGNLTFEADPLNQVDALIFSILSYTNLEFVNESEKKISLGMLPGELIKIDYCEGNYGPKLISSSVKNLVNMAAESDRFKDIVIRSYRNIIDEEKQMQFAAAAFELPGDGLFIAYRGTDESLIGWKEDLNMCFTDGIPSQIEASIFADKVIQKTDRQIYIGGHSKGGNMAVWTATNLSDDKKERLCLVFNNDGPGFSKEFLQTDKYMSVRNKIMSFVPESSIVGILLEHDEYICICSSNPSIFQHDPFSWSVTSDHFDVAKKRTVLGQQMDYYLNSWIRSLEKEEREEFVETIWTIISSSNAKTLNDLTAAKIKSVLSMQKTFITMEPVKQKQLITSIIKMVFNGKG